MKKLVVTALLTTMMLSTIAGGFAYAGAVDSTGTEKACEDYTGVSFEPLAYIASQMVAGTNH